MSISAKISHQLDWLLEQGDIIQQANQLLSFAIEHHASDIHIEPYAALYRIRLRQDGLLQELSSVATPLANSIIARLKVLSHLDVAEKRLPQDGHFSLPLDDGVVDFRLSTCPTIYGEKAVVRILNPAAILKQIEELGFEAVQKQLFIAALNNPQGLILFIGPTGSGKTVSLYAALQYLNPAAKNILTIEDPVEISIQGINQVNVNVKAGLTYASALKAFLRQDPDIIMLGEIRDVETAQSVIKASQTGHLIFSTLHAQDTVQALDRLLNLDLNKAQVQSNLLLLVAQRLVRKLCDFCKRAIRPPSAFLKTHQVSSNAILYTAVGCSHCQLGYRGRVGIFELLPITEAVIQEFSQRHYRLSLLSLLQNYGLSLRAAAVHKVIQGITSLEEIDRIIPITYGS